MDIGSKIKNARNKAGFTQEQTAESLGVSRQTISNWENGKNQPDLEMLALLSLQEKQEANANRKKHLPPV